MMLEAIAALALLGSPPASDPGQIDCAVLRAIDDVVVTTGDALAPASVEDHRVLVSPEAAVARGLGLTPAETEQLRREVARVAEPYLVNCWRSPEVEIAHQTKAAFTRPLFVSRNLAVVGLRIDGRDRGVTYGCAVRRTGRAWRATCHRALVWAR